MASVAPVDFLIGEKFAGGRDGIGWAMLICCEERDVAILGVRFDYDEAVRVTKEDGLQRNTHKITIQIHGVVFGVAEHYSTGTAHTYTS